MSKAMFQPVEWCLRTNVYEVNVRQYTPEGSFSAFARHLPRLKSMGVETIWFMPITPIGEPKRLGTLGSYYACSSYVKVNPEFGTIEDFKEVVTQAHMLGMKVIIDWVANHTGYGHEWMEGRKRDYYARDPSGNFSERNGWEDVADLDYNNNDMRREMIESMQYWIKTCDIDGFRCDMAHLVPLDFWIEARTQCDAIKPLFWLGEMEVPAYHSAFDASYAWEWMHESKIFMHNNYSTTVLERVLYKYKLDYPSHALKLFFTTNHDENSWNGTEFEKYGAAALPLFVFSATYDGIPLIYSGQELPNLKRLKFFDKDQIDWTDHLLYASFFNSLLALRKRNQAVGGPNGHAKHHWIHTPFVKCMAYLREHGRQKVVVLLNFGNDTLSFRLHDDRVNSKYAEIFTAQQRVFKENRNIELPPFGYLVYEKQ